MLDNLAEMGSTGPNRGPETLDIRENRLAVKLYYIIGLFIWQ